MYGISRLTPRRRACTRHGGGSESHERREIRDEVAQRIQRIGWTVNGVGALVTFISVGFLIPTESALDRVVERDECGAWSVGGRIVLRGRLEATGIAVLASRLDAAT